MTWAGFSCLGLGTGVAALWKWQRILVFHKSGNFFWLDEELLASQVKTLLRRVSVPPLTAINFPVQFCKTAILYYRNQEQMLKSPKSNRAVKEKGNDPAPCNALRASFGATRFIPEIVCNTSTGHRCSTVVKVLCYKSEGRWPDPRCCNWIFHWHKILPIALWP